MAIAPNQKIAIVGAGNVGATIAYACLVQGVGRALVLYDADRKKVEAQALDLNHGLQFVPAASVDGSNDPAICANADVIVITAGAKQKPGQTRLDLAAANVQMCRDLIPKLLRVAPEAILLLVTNPVDVITYVALKLSGRPPASVFGSGTVLDSSRFRFLIAQRCRVSVANVHATIVGEHGDSEVPLWSSATIGGVPLHEWAVPGHGKPSVHDRAEILQNVKQSAYRIIEGKGATSYAIGLATAQILAATLRDESRVMPVSALLNDYRGISNVCLSVPRLVNRSGVEAPLPAAMNQAEELGLKNSAEAVSAVIRSLGF